MTHDYTPPGYMMLLKSKNLHIAGIGLQAVIDLQMLQATPVQIGKPSQGSRSPTPLKAIGYLIKTGLVSFSDGQYQITEDGTRYLKKLEVAKCLP